MDKDSEASRCIVLLWSRLYTYHDREQDRPYNVQLPRLPSGGAWPDRHHCGSPVVPQDAQIGELSRPELESTEAHLPLADILFFQPRSGFRRNAKNELAHVHGPETVHPHFRLRRSDLHV